METIKIYVEDIIGGLGLTGDLVPIVRHCAMAAVAVILAWLGDFLSRRLLVPIVMRITARTEAEWDEVIFNRKVLVSACHIVPAIIIWRLLPLVFYQYPVVEEIVRRLTAIYITVMSTRTAVCLIDSFHNYETEGRRSNMEQYARSFSSVLKIVIMFLAAIVVISIVLNRSPLTLLAGLGATSAILMLIFQDTITGLVAGIRLTAADMLHKGDWITVEKSGVNGVVEDMTLTTVKVRNFDNTIVTISPKTLVGDSFQNWIGMQESDGRRVDRRVCYDARSVKLVDNDLKEQLLKKGYFSSKELAGGPFVNLTLFRQYMERYLIGRDDVNEQMTYFVSEDEASANGIPVEFYFFLKQKNWEDYEHHMSDIMDFIYAVSGDFGLTVHQYFPQQ